MSKPTSHHLVIDLRPKSQRNHPPIPHQHVLPLNMAQIEDGTYQLEPKPSQILVVCDQGMHAKLAARYLTSDGWPAQAWTGAIADLHFKTMN